MTILVLHQAVPPTFYNKIAPMTLSTTTSLSRPLQRGLPYYANPSPFVSLTRPSRYPDRDYSLAVTKLLIEHRVTRPRILSVCLRWKTGNLSPGICSAASRCLEAPWIQG